MEDYFGMKIHSSLILASILVLALSGCSTTQYTPTGGLEGDIRSQPRGTIDAEIERSSEAVHSYLVGRISYMNEDYDRALLGYRRASELIEDDEPQIHSTLAELYIRRGELEEAEGEIKRLLEIEPENVGYRMLYAGVLESLDDISASEQIYRELLSEDPPVVEAYLLLASLLAREKGVEQGVDVLDQLITQQPEHIMAHFYQGRFHETLERYQLSYKHLRKAHELADDPDAFVADIIRVLLKGDKHQEMEQFCSDLLERYPSHPLARRVLGELAIGERRYEDALQHLEIATESQDDATAVRFRIAMIQMERRDLQSAERELSLVLANSPDHAEARYYLASLYAGSGRISQAIKELKLIESDGELYVRSQNFLAYLLRQQDKRAEAIKVVRALLLQVPDNMRARLYLAFLLREERKFHEAIEILEAAISDDPNNERALFQYGVTLYDTNRRDESLGVMERIIEINPAQSDALNFVAYELAERGVELKRAEELSRRSLEIRPADGYYLDTLGWIMFQKGDFAEAEVLLRRAAELTGNDVVITYHLIRVLIENDKRAEALRVASSILKAIDPEELTDPEAKESYRDIEELARSLQE